MGDSGLDYSHYFWQGDKVRLRPVRTEDAEVKFLGLLDSPSRSDLQLGIELPTTLEALRSSLEKWLDCQESEGAILFAVETLGGEYVGGVSLHSMDRKNGVFSFGVAIDAPHRSKGYAKDAVAILLRYGFQERRFQKCNSATVHTNSASIALHTSLGFTEEGRVRRRWFYNGQYHDDVLFGMTAEEFEARWKGECDSGSNP
jgi:RimJ/RimL family protein N-acetyltransferase